MFTAAFVTFISITLLMLNLPPHWMRRAAGYKFLVDLTVFIAIAVYFASASTDGRFQIMAAGILFSLWIRGYRWLFGYEVFDFSKRRWQPYEGVLKRFFP